MPETTIPLFTPETRRGMGVNVSTTKDSFLSACVLEKVIDNSSGSVSYYVQKRPGIVSGVIGSGIGSFAFKSPAAGYTLLAYGGSNSTIIIGGVATGGTITGICESIIETIINGVIYWVIASSDGTGWYLANASFNDTSFTGDTHTNTTIDNIAGASGIYVGQLITGSGIQAGTRIASRTPDTSTPTSITTTIATTATASITITKEPIAKIIDADFPSIVGAFSAMDGYLFAVTSNGKLYNSDLNSVTSWSASNYIEANIQTDNAITTLKYRNHIVVFGNRSIEFFYNTGNPSGSILSSRKEVFSNVGMYGVSFSIQVFQIRDLVFWVGNDQCLYTFDGLTPKNISRQGMTIGGISSVANALQAFPIGSDIIVHIPTSSASKDKWYSVENNFYYEPNLSIAQTFWVDAEAYSTAQIAVGVSNSDTGGKMYTLNSSVYQDEGAAFTMTIQTEPKVLNKGDPFIVKRTRLIADNQSSGTTNLDMSADDYANWIDIGDFDMTGTQKEVWGGLYCESSCAFKLEHSANTAWRGQAIVVDWEPAHV